MNIDSREIGRPKILQNDGLLKQIIHLSRLVLIKKLMENFILI